MSYHSTQLFVCHIFFLRNGRHLDEILSIQLTLLSPRHAAYSFSLMGNLYYSQILTDRGYTRKNLKINFQHLCSSTKKLGDYTVRQISLLPMTPFQFSVMPLNHGDSSAVFLIKMSMLNVFVYLSEQLIKFALVIRKENVRCQKQ